MDYFHGTAALPLLDSDHALFLDFDGTLVPIAARPEAVAVPPYLAVDLERLSASLGGALAIVTGRRLIQIDQHLHPWRGPGAGAHGAEYRYAASAPITAEARVLPDGWFAALEQKLEGWPGVWLEDKRYGAALHFRQNPGAGPACLGLMREAACGWPLDVIEGHCVVEVRPAGVNKGRAIQSLCQTPLLRGRIPVFVGDDVSDEAGFDVVQHLGGFGVRVGSGVTAARYRLDGPDAVRAWLRRSLETTGMNP